MAGLPLVPGDTGPMVSQMQTAIIAKGYSVGPAGANGNFNEDTLFGLEAFQDNDALPVQAKCDQQCWTALGLPGP
jgi:eukaryotic-like serine/threonine-protein kinase